MNASGMSDVTVVIACFNYGQYLEETVSSALGQRGGAPSVIVVDDGSTDPVTRDVLARLPAQVRVIEQRNAGVCAARNRGIFASTSPFVIVLDADDRLPPDALGLLRPPLERDSSLGFTYGLTRFFGDWQGLLRMPPYDPYQLLHRHTIGLSALVRREVFEVAGGFDPAFPYLEDWELWVNALAHGWRGRRVEAVTFEYRKHGAGKHSGDRRRYREVYRAMRRKHRALYARRDEFAGESAMGPAGRAVYRWFWGPRPVPARVEAALHRALFRRGRRV